ncbi:MAG: pyridoxal 5'-phosphate synthase glutaminase subunit PdxT [Chloroflexota bacterium]|nr:pyridoxal 5'-phosphate synthase glutaminase subunit PdxT [Chloroflexota bacterium]
MTGDFSDLTIGVLALQGAFAEHVAMLERLGARAREVRLASDLNGLDGLIIPGGESTTIGKLLVAYDLLEPLRALAARDFPIYGTCAGTILLARDIGGLDQPLLGTMDLTVERNAFGRQLQSFEADLSVAGLGERPFRAVFIRAPAIRGVGDGAEALAALDDGTIVAARQDNLLVTCFHPELTADDRLHRLFLEQVRAAKAAHPAEAAGVR